MSTKGRKSAKSPSNKGSSAKKPALLKFGSVTIEARSSGHGDRGGNIREGQFALKRAGAQIIKPGIKIKVAEDVPLFHADPTNPQQVVRVLRGKSETGVFVQNKFKPRQ